MFRVLLVVLVVACGAARPSVRPAATASALPPLQATLVSGATWSYQRDAAGRLLVIDVWASWCKPCTKGLQHTARLAAAHPDVAVLGLSIDEDDTAMRAFLAETGVTFANARVAPGVVQDAPLSIASLPAVIVVDRRGLIRWIATDMQDDDYGALEKVLAQLRRE
jgi:thiol-disulfide isomerase/thioredoxin